ncbi:hypothetical protein F444_03661 [Phytophthora nicotianae P1976]|uniref:Uncharacterized protein n=1 Tax=Phytophthora nicotianae P1976 TaxID=1317066 RepID=A0A081AT89_PHYNI|nr:hypothetical protein F444_03661 [Phytophthora nicotianae P1976]
MGSTVPRLRCDKAAKNTDETNPRNDVEAKRRNAGVGHRSVEETQAISAPSNNQECSAGFDGVTKTQDHRTNVGLSDKVAVNSVETIRRNTVEAGRRNMQFIDRVADTQDKKSAPSRDQKISAGFVIKMRRSRLGLVIKIDVHRQVLNKIDGRVLCKIDVQTRALGEIVGWSQRHIGLVIKIVEQSQHKHSRSEELKQADGTEGGHVLDAISAPHELGRGMCISEGGDFYAEDVDDNMAVLPKPR